MTSFKLLFLIGVCLTLLDASVSDPIPQKEIHEVCGREVEKNEFMACNNAIFPPDDVIRGLYNESSCPKCTHICRNSEPMLECAFNIIGRRVLCNKFGGYVDEPFVRGIFASILAFFCEGDGDRLAAIYNSPDILVCILTQFRGCVLNFIPDDIEDDSSLEFIREALCRSFTSGLYCMGSKAEECNQEAAEILVQFADYIKSHNPCA